MAELKKLWKVPTYGQSRSEDVFNFAIGCVRDGMTYFESSPAYQQLEESIRILSGRPSSKLAEKQKDDRYSKVHTNVLKRNVREMVNALSDIRFTPGYYTDNNEFQAVGETLNRTASFWYADRFIDVQWKKTLQWMAITSCAYMELMYRTIPGERDKQEIELIPHSAFEVVHTGVPQGGDLQEAYTVTIIRDLPIYLAHAIWPAFTEQLIPDRETPLGWSERILQQMRDVFDATPTTVTAKNPTVRLYYQYILDLSINMSGKPMTMGLDPNDGTQTSWTYVVPYIGQMIPAGYDDNGTQVFRPANKKDCRIFPGRRLAVFTDSKLIYDGPFWDWHGKVPLVKVSADPWPFADYSMIHDNANVQEAIGEMERMMHQTARNKMNPSILYNMRAMTRDKAKAFRTEVTGQRIGFNGSEGNDPAKPALPASFYEVEGWQPELVKYFTETMKFTMGINDIGALAKARQGANADSMEKLMELAGPIVKGLSRDMERAFRDLADMYKFMVFQYYDTPRIMKIVGVDGVTPENFDFDPGNLVPSHLPGENVKYPSIHSQRERAKWVADHVGFFITPNTLHQITQTVQKMIYLQLWRQGFPIDPWTLAEIFNIGNFGKIPEGGKDIMSRWKIWRKMQLEEQVEMAEEMQELQGGAAAGGAPNAPGLGPNGGQKGTGGRASSGQTSPHLTPGNASRGQRMRESH